MTITIGFIDGNVAIVATDSAAVCEDEISVRTGTPKSWSVNIGPYSLLVGICGDFGTCNWIQHGFKWPKLPRDLDIISWLTAIVAPAMEASIKKRYPDVPYPERCEWQLMLACPATKASPPRIFIFNNNGDVAEPLQHFAAIGSGSSAALGALYATRDSRTLSSWQKIEMALEASAEIDKHVRRPWHVKWEMSS